MKLIFEYFRILPPGISRINYQYIINKRRFRLISVEPQINQDQMIKTNPFSEKERVKNIFLSKYIIIVINQFNRIRSIKFSWKDHSCDWSKHWQRSFKNIEIDKNRTKFNLWSFKRSIWTDLITDNFSHSWLFKSAKYYCTQKYSVFPNKFMQRFDLNLTLSNFYK